MMMMPVKSCQTKLLLDTSVKFFSEHLITCHKVQYICLTFDSVSTQPLDLLAEFMSLPQQHPYFNNCVLLTSPFHGPFPETVSTSQLCVVDFLIFACPHFSTPARDCVSLLHNSVSSWWIDCTYPSFFHPPA